MPRVVYLMSRNVISVRVSKSAVVSPSGWPRAGLDWASRSWHVQDVLAAPTRAVSNWW